MLIFCLVQIGKIELRDFFMTLKVIVKRKLGKLSPNWSPPSCLGAAPEQRIKLQNVTVLMWNTVSLLLLLSVFLSAELRWKHRPIQLCRFQMWADFVEHVLKYFQNWVAAQMLAGWLTHLAAQLIEPSCQFCPPRQFCSFYFTILKLNAALGCTGLEVSYIRCNSICSFAPGYLPLFANCI